MINEALESFNNKKENARCNISLRMLFRSVSFLLDILVLIWLSSFLVLKTNEQKSRVQEGY
jgi:hypothetical protein